MFEHEFALVLATDPSEDEADKLYAAFLWKQRGISITRKSSHCYRRNESCLPTEMAGRKEIAKSRLPTASWRLFSWLVGMGLRPQRFLNPLSLCLLLSCSGQDDFAAFAGAEPHGFSRVTT